MNAIFWDHEVGSAGIETENRYAVYYRTGPGGPKIYVPIVRGTPAPVAEEEVFSAFGAYEVIIEEK